MKVFEVIYEKSGVYYNQIRTVYANSLREAQIIACILCDDNKRRVLDVYEI